MSKIVWMAAVLAMMAGPVVADDTKVDSKGERYKLLSCHKKVTVPAQYKVTKKLVKAAERKYVKKGNMIELREYPAIYREVRTKVRDGYFLIQEVACAPAKK